MSYNKNEKKDLEKRIVEYCSHSRDFLKVFLEYSYLLLKKRGKIFEPKLDIKEPSILEFNEIINDKLNTDLFNYLNVADFNSIDRVIQNTLYGPNYKTEFFQGYIEGQLDFLAYELLEIRKNESVLLDLNSELGSFSANILRYSKSEPNYINPRKIYCNIIDKDDAYLASIILDIYKTSNVQVEIINDNYLKRDLSLEFDRAKFKFPLGSRINGGSLIRRATRMFDDIPFKKIASCEWGYIDRIFKTDSNSFKYVALVTGKTLWDSTNAIYRNKMIENGYLEGIIELPKKLSKLTNKDLYFLVFSRDNTEIKFFDASSYQSINKEGLGEKKSLINLEVGKMIDGYKNCKNTKTNEEAIHLKSLVPSVVNEEKKVFKNSVLLKDIADIFTGTQHTLGNFDDFYSSDDTGFLLLSTNNINNYYIEKDSMKYVKTNNICISRYSLQEGDVVLAIKSSKIKVGVIDFEIKDQIFVTGGMLVIRPNRDKIDPIYLKLYLDSEEGQKYLRTIQKGSSMLSLKVSDLSELPIPLISMDKQQELSSRYRNKISTLIAYQNEIKKVQKDLDCLFKLEEVE